MSRPIVADPWGHERAERAERIYQALQREGYLVSADDYEDPEAAEIRLRDEILSTIMGALSE